MVTQRSWREARVTTERTTVTTMRSTSTCTSPMTTSPIGWYWCRCYLRWVALLRSSANPTRPLSLTYGQSEEQSLWQWRFASLNNWIDCFSPVRLVFSKSKNEMYTQKFGKKCYKYIWPQSLRMGEIDLWRGLSMGINFFKVSCIHYKLLLGSLMS